MKKIPTLFVRDPEDRKHVLPIVTPGAEWVLEGEGVATRKFDGTCVLILRGHVEADAYARREVKPGKTPPPNWVEVDRDDTTGKRMGWEPIEQSGWLQPFTEAVGAYDETLLPGTYELCGPKINGNPEGFGHHALIPHGQWDLDGPHAWIGEHAEHHAPPRDFDGLRAWLLDRTDEGIVWWREPGNAEAGLVKLKRRDFA